MSKAGKHILTLAPIPQQEIWAFPDASDLSPRRLVNCANLTRSLGTDADDLRRYVCASDLQEKEDSRYGLFQNLNEEQQKIVNDLLGGLSEAQLGAFSHIRDSKHPIVFIQGPLGTAKTTFIVTLMQILWRLNISWIACAPSNSATVLQRKCPEMGAIRFHVWDNEARSIRHTENELRKADGDEMPDDVRKVDDEAKDPEAAEDDRLFYAFMMELQNEDQEWKGKLARPNFKDMSLHVRALQNAGITSHDLECFARSDNDSFAAFRETLKDRDFDKQKSDEEKERYRTLEEELMSDTIRRSKGLITTLSKTADNKMKSAKIPEVAIIDECCQSTELESLLPWTHNTESLRKIIYVGDPKQLSAAVPTLNRFSAQLCSPFFSTPLDARF